MVIVAETEIEPLDANSHVSIKSRPSKSPKTSPRRKRSWYGQCCCCGGGVRSTWSVSSPAKFYCCRADLVADMARERGERSTKPLSKDVTGMEEEQPFGCDDDGDYEFAEEALPDETFREVFNRSHQDDTDERWDIQEPDLPHVENLPHQLSSGRVIIIEGAVLPNAEGFAVNLACGGGQEPDLALHLNPRLDRGYVARNSRSRGTWGEEHQAALGGSPFRPGQPFLIHILVTATGFKISVNRMHLCNFQFRMPLSKVCRLEIHGDIVLSSVKHTRLEVYPDRPLDASSDDLFPTIPTDYAVPWSIDLPKLGNLFIGHLRPHLRPNIEITIKGRVKILPQSFYVNLQQGSQLWPHPNIHFHLNPRFAAEDFEHVVIANAWLHMTWGSEQRYSRCRFTPGKPFTMVIYVEEERYRVTVDGLQQAAMAHRAPSSLVDTLVVRGDVVVTHVAVAPSAPAPERLLTPGTPLEGSPTGSFDQLSMGMSMPRATRTDSLIALRPDSDVDMDRDSQDPSEASTSIRVNALPTTTASSGTPVLIDENMPSTSAAASASCWDRVCEDVIEEDVALHESVSADEGVVVKGDAVEGGSEADPSASSPSPGR